MSDPTTVPVHFPALYWPVASGLSALLVETWYKRQQPWAMPSAVLYGTIAAWYFADLIVNPEQYEFLPDSLLNISYCQVAVFLAVYRLALPWLTRKFVKNAVATQKRRASFRPKTIFGAAVALWLVLLTYGVSMLHGNLLGALFPVGARSGEVMWERAAAGDAGASGFLVSSAGYVYLLVCGSFGVWVVLLRAPMRWLAVGLILVSWPYFLLSGTRSIFLVVSLPLFLAYLLFGRNRLWVKVVFLAVSFGLLSFAFKVVITYRDIGFQALFSDQSHYSDAPETLSANVGLNMIEELCYTNLYSATHAPAYGTRYLQEAVNVVPRVLWPSKPLLGVDYAVWRGFAGGDSDIGVVATISSGMIGGGVLNFGSWLGPLAPALLVAAWSALLARWWTQRASLLRCFLFLVGLGLTFNLGRDITLLVLWPIVFGYLIVRVAEYVATPGLVSNQAGDRRYTPAIGPRHLPGRQHHRTSH